MAEDLLSMFTSMGTTDHGELLQQFLMIIPGAPPEAAQFFLEANSMNLQGAIMSYMDQGGTGAVSQAMVQPPQATFICDVTIGEGEAITPGTSFQKTWRLQNTGQEAWPNGTTLQFIQGEKLGGQQSVRVPMLEPGAVTDLSVDLTSPSTVGTFAGSWRLCAVDGGVPSYFGEEIWVVIAVSETGMLDALQRMHGTSIDPSQQFVAQAAAQQGMSGQQQFGGGFGQQQQQQQQQQFAGGFGQPAAAAPAQPQNPFGVPQFGSLSTHSFGANMPTFGAPAPGQGLAFGQQHQGQGQSGDAGMEK